jgi:hypothetical protein
VLGWLLCTQVVLDEHGAIALSRLLEATPTLQQLELCRQVDLDYWLSCAVLLCNRHGWLCCA